jgi:hypothetical protein
VIPYGGHQSVLCGNVIRVWVPISCPDLLGLPLWSSLRCIWDTAGHLPPSIGIVYTMPIIIFFPRALGVTQRSIKVRNVASSKQYPLCYPFFGCAHGTNYHSMIWNELLASRMPRETSVEVRNFSSLLPRVFSDLSSIHGHSTPTMLGHLNQSLFPSVDGILASFAGDGPLLPRLILTGALASPVVAISLQRDTIDIGGNQGMLSIGELPAGLAMEDLTWVPLRGYTTAEGGLPAPEESPNEVHLRARIILALMNVESDLPHYLGSLH